MKGFEEFMIHPVTVETHVGEDSWGNTHAPESEPVMGFFDDKRQLVRAASGDQVVSESTFITDKEHEALFAPESIVHYRGRSSTVIACSFHDSGDLGLPDHIEVSLT